MPNNNPSKLVSLRKPDYKGSWWKDYVKERTTLPIGLFTPVRTFDIPANTLFKVKPDIRFESLPMLSPVYDGFTMRTKFYFVPYRLYIPNLRQNRQLSWGAIENYRFPWVNLGFRTYLAENQNVNSYARCSFAGSLLDRLGLSYGEMSTGNSFNNHTFVNPNSTNSEAIYVNAVKLLAYIDCWLRGEYNPQDLNIPVFQEVVGIDTVSGSPIRRYGTYKMLSHDKLQKFIEMCYGYTTNLDTTLGSLVTRGVESEGFSVKVGGVTNGTFDNSLFPLTTSMQFYSEQSGQTSAFTNGDYMRALDSNWDSLRNMSSNVGLLPVTYKGDYLMSWYNADGIARLEQFVVNNGDNFLTLRKKNADMLIELLASVSGNSYVDILQYVFDSYLELRDHPIMIGYDELHFGSNEETTSTAQTSTDGNGVLGSVASKARDYSNKVKPLSVKTKEPGMVMVFSAIIPNVVYYQGVDRFDLKLYWNDIWHPQYDSKGFQTIQPEEYYNPFSTPTYGMEDEKLIWPNYDTLVTNHFVSPRVPLGWEYMKRNSHLSGAMKTPRFRTWSLTHDFGVIGFSDVKNLLEIDKSSYGEYVNPLSSDTDEQTITGLWLADLSSTYVKGFDYNIPFANYDAFDNQNFVVNYGFVISQYQPITHTLITKNI